MNDQLINLWENISQFLTNKIASGVAAGAIIVSSEAAKHTAYIDITESGFLWFTFAVWFQVIGSVWIATLLLEKIGVFKLIKWIWGKLNDDN